MRSRLFKYVLLGAMLLECPASFAGLYQKESLAAFDIDEHGNAVPLPRDTFLSIVYSDKKALNPELDEGKRLREQVAALEKIGTTNLSPEQKIRLASHLLHLPADAANIANVLNLLKPLISRPPEGSEFQAYVTQGHAFWLRRQDPIDYEQAHRLTDMAIKDFKLPKQMPGLTTAQLKWYQRFEENYHLPFMKRRMEEASRKGSHDTLDPLFPGPKKGEAVRFVGETGKFEPEGIAAAERAKLPADAIAIVQQLLIWYPTDGRLWWLLGELYNALGDLESAEKILFICTSDEVKYTNPELRAHYHEIFEIWKSRNDAEAARKADEEARRVAEEERMRRRKLAVGSGVALLVLAVVYWQAREVRRKFKRRAQMAQHTQSVE